MAPRDEQLIVCYDGACELCITAVGRLRRLDRGRRLRMVPYQRAATELPELAAVVGSTALTSALQVMEPGGTWTAGGEAVLRIAESVPRLRFVARLGRLPVVNRLVEPLYRQVARHRHRLSRLLRPAGSAGG